MLLRGRRIVFGTMTFGWNQASQKIDEKVGRELLDLFAQKASHVEIDTARIYSQGNTEKILGRILNEEAGKRRKHFQIATKVHPMVNGVNGFGGLEPSKLRAQFNECLSSLQIDKVDILYLHSPDLNTPLEETLEACNTLHKEGRFSQLGLSNYSAWETVQSWHICDKNGWVKPSVYQGMYNAITREVEKELLPALSRHNISFLAYNPLAGGLLTGKHNFNQQVEGRFKDNPMYLDRFWKDSFFKSIGQIQETCANAKIGVTEASFRWLFNHSQLNQEKNDGVLIGASSVQQLQQNLDSCYISEPLPQPILDAFDRAWDNCRVDCPKYFRP